MALPIFFVPRLLADKNNFSGVWSFAEDGLGRPRVQVAPPAGFARLPAACAASDVPECILLRWLLPFCGMVVLAIL
jgi:hypothetical protein